MAEKKAPMFLFKNSYIFDYMTWVSDCFVLVQRISTQVYHKKRSSYFPYSFHLDKCSSCINQFPVSTLCIVYTHYSNKTLLWSTGGGKDQLCLQSTQCYRHFSKLIHFIKLFHWLPDIHMTTWEYFKPNIFQKQKSAQWQLFKLRKSIFNK